MEVGHRYENLRRAFFAETGSRDANGAVTAGTYGALVAQLRDLRTVGVRGSFNF